MRFEEFAAARLPALLRYAGLLTGDRELARDITQEVLARALVKWRRISTVDEPYAYVRTMVTNEYLSFRRRKSLPTVALTYEALDGPRAPADADPVVIRQVWCNLIGNALKYSAKRDKPKISVSGRIDNGETIYQVDDNGAGFDMRYAEKLFGVFQRLHRSEDFSGTGVGLAIVHRIIARHGGRIWAKGVPDAGASFQFALPIR